MDKNEKKEKKNYISSAIEMANARLKDNEVDLLSDLVLNRKTYDGLAKSFKKTIYGISSEGKYTRNEKNTFTIRDNKDGLHIEELIEYSDDDGYSGKYVKLYKTAREILSVIGKIK